MTRLLALTVLLGLVGGCTARFSESFGDGTEVEAVTIANLWAPNVTVVKLPDGSYHVVGGSSTVGQLAGPAAVAYAGHQVGEGLEESGDTLNVEAASATAEGGDASASSAAGVDIDIDLGAPPKGKKWP